MLPSIETICLEGIDPDVMEDEWANLGKSNLTILYRKILQMDNYLFIL